MSQRLVHDDASPRTPLDEAIKQILKLLVENEKSFSITGLARESGLHRKTVQKCIELLVVLEDKWLEDYKLKLHEVDNRKLVALERRIGLLSYPEEVQRFIIKAKYFPMPSEETYLMIYLYLKDATSPEKALSLKENEIVKKLIKQEKIKKKKEKKETYYLSDEGITIAKGALQIYPDLKKQKDSI
jgi:predicted transcriptional regulator